MNADINASAGIVLSKLAVDPLARSNHTGSQLASTISDFNEATDDRVAALIAPSGLLVETYDDAGNSLGYNVPAGAASDINTGTDTTKALTADALAGSVMGSRTVVCLVTDFATNTATGDGKFYFTVPEELNGMDLIAAHAQVITAGTTGTTDIQLARQRPSSASAFTTVDMLSTKLTIDSAELGSQNAATAAVINTSNDDVATNDQIRIDVDAVSTTPAKGLIVRLRFMLP